MKEKKEQPKCCTTCKHWYNNQRLLNYSEDNGFCLNPNFKFSINVGRIVGIIDMGNIKDQIKVSGNPSHDIETKEEFGSPGYGKMNFERYLLQTNSYFGCIFHKEKK